MSRVRKRVLKFLEGRGASEKVPTNDKEALFSPFQREIVEAIEKKESLDYSMITGRRTGKTVMTAILPAYLEKFHPEWKGDYGYASSDVGYIKKLYWEKIVFYLKAFGIKYLERNVYNYIVLPQSGRMIIFHSLKDGEAAKKTRGFEHKCMLYEESQSVRQDILRETVEEHAGPSVLDHKGFSLCFGTPPKIHRSSYFLKRHRNKAVKSWDGINVFDNPFIKRENALEFMKQERLKRGLTEGSEDPKFRREILGELVEDKESVIFPLGKSHVYKKLPDDLNVVNFYFTGGIDIGFDDSDAVVVLLYHPKSKTWYLDYEYEKSGESTAELARVLSEVGRKYNGEVYWAGDSGGGGKKTIYDLSVNWGIMVETAVKRDKLANVIMLRDLILQNRFFVKEDSLFLRESDLICWNEDRSKVDDKEYHSDLLDAILYGMRRLAPFAGSS